MTVCGWSGFTRGLPCTRGNRSEGEWHASAEQVRWGDDADDGAADDGGQSMLLSSIMSTIWVMSAPGVMDSTGVIMKSRTAGGGAAVRSPALPAARCGAGRQVGCGDDADQISVRAGDRRRGMAMAGEVIGGDAGGCVGRERIHRVRHHLSGFIADLPGVNGRWVRTILRDALSSGVFQ